MFIFVFWQVNREMMGVIESLQRQTEQQMEESSEELSAKSDENLVPDEEMEFSKPCDSGEKVLKEINKNDLDPPKKGRKVAGGKIVVESEAMDDAEVESEAMDFD